jgi:hypothetical protein
MIMMWWVLKGSEKTTAFKFVEKQQYLFFAKYVLVKVSTEEINGKQELWE